MPTIEATDLVKVYGGEVRAVDGVSLTVAAGEVFGFLGPNGAGKSTTVKLLTTLHRLTSGRAIVAGHDVSTDPAAVRARIGVALQDAGLDGLMTARETLQLQGSLYGIPDPAGRAAELLDVVGLMDAADRQVRGFSGGMKRRLDLATGLVHRPTLLFLDEPTTGLDPASRAAVWDEVRRLNAKGTTIFLTTQYLEEADALCDRLAIIDHGRIVAEGTPTSMKESIAEDIVRVTITDRAHVKARKAIEALNGVVRVDREEGKGPVRLSAFVRDGSQAVAAVVRELDSEGIEFGEISLHKPTLDDVFLQATGSRLEGAESADPSGPDANGRAPGGRRGRRKVSA